MGAGGPAARARVRVRVEGTVQGVGFRPFVYRLAHEEALAGHVLNDERGVVIEAEGVPSAIERLLDRLRAEAPPLASIERILPRAIEPTGSDTFEIRNSSRGGRPDAVVAPDTATCDDCLRELLDPADRRFRYPFINCTNCGPRLTIVEGVPYDRALTTMAAFAMCPECEREYGDPSDRRFHAQPNACPACGPRARLLGGDGREERVAGGRDAVQRAAVALARGAIVAVKGVGGYHLACDARDERAVRTLRARKHREDKPLALMATDVNTAATLVALGPAARAALGDPAHPIVLAARAPDAAVAPSVAPNAPELGVMLAYTPLHHLLLADVGQLQRRPAVLVMTSGNVSDEPIAYEDEDALARLGAIADAILVHDRPIRSRVDDSVVRADDSAVRVRDGAGARAGEDAGMQMLRRSRGYVPAPLALPVGARRPLLACGADLKSAFCLARGARAWLSHHIGDLEHYPALVSYRDGIAWFQRLFDVHPELVVHDLHPGYASTAYAMARDDVAVLGVQHHHAHLAACVAEHGRDSGERVVGAIYDGTGYGTDGTVWGGEVLVGGLSGFERVAALRAVAMPGGAAAIREPWRMAHAWLAAAGSGGETGDAVKVPSALAAHVDAAHWKAMAAVAADPTLSPQTTSMGRLFDALAALCGIAPRVSYEGQAAIELTAAVGHAPAPATSRRRDERYEIDIRDGDRVRWELDPRRVIVAAAADIAAGVDVAIVGAAFHGAVAAATADACARAAAAAGVDTVVLSGGVFQNAPLLAQTSGALRRAGLQVLTPRRVPCNDGGISFGQAAIAAVADAGV